MRVHTSARTAGGSCANEPDIRSCLNHAEELLTRDHAVDLLADQRHALAHGALVGEQRWPKRESGGITPALFPGNNPVRPALETETALLKKAASGCRAVVPVVQAGVIVLAVTETGLHLSVQTIPSGC